MNSALESAHKLKSSNVVSYLLVVVAMISIQSGASLAKNLFPILGPEGTTTLRLGIAAVILCSIWRPWRHSLSRTEKISILAYGLSLGAMNFLFYQAIERIPLGLAVGLEFTGPLSVSLLASRKSLDFLWAGLAALGIYLILPAMTHTTSLDPVGVIFALSAGACWAGYILFGQRAGGFTHAGTVTAWGMVAAALLVSPFGLVTSGSAFLQISIWPVAILVGILSSALPYSLEMLALRSLPTKNFGILMSAEPAIAAISGVLFLHEQLMATQWLALLSIMVASMGSAMTSQITQAHS